MEHKKNPKTQIILQEIQHWKKNKLLPEHYCDFLITLYTEGSENSIKRTKGIKSNFIRYILTFLLSIAVIGFLVLYFSDFLQQMQISLGLFLLIVFFIMMLVGIIMRIFYLQCLGLFFVVVMIAWNSQSYFETNFTWFLLEGAWLLGAIVFGVLAWVCRFMNQKLSLNLLVNSSVIIFIPSFQAVYIAEASLDIVQILIFIKVILLSLLWYTNKERLFRFIKNSFQ
jgi:hypothetical protein